MLRAAVAADLPRIAALARWVWLDAYVHEGVSDAFAGYLEREFNVDALGATLAREPMWVIEDGDYLRAWVETDASSEPGKVEIARLYVAPPFHGQGFGARLLRHVRAAVPDRAVWLKAWEGNAGALRFYRREGAALVGETWFELDGQRHRNEVLGWPALQA